MAHKKAYRKGFVVFPKIGYSDEDGKYSEKEAIRGFGLRKVHQKAREEWGKDKNVKDMAMFFKIFDAKGILT